MLAPKNGRLSHLRNVIHKFTDAQFDEVRNVILCMSYLDASNQPGTNFSNLRTILYSAHRIFPCANLFVLLTSMQDASASPGLVATNDLVLKHRPGGCEILEPPGHPSNVLVWDDTFRTNVFDLLRAHLN